MIAGTHLRFWIGLGLIGALLVVALLSPLLPLPDPNAMSLPDQFLRPSWLHWFGTDQNGSSVLARVVFGARVSLLVGFSVVLCSATIGLLVGSFAGYWGGWVDLLVMRFLDVLNAFPGFLLAIALMTILGPSIENVILAMCATGWSGYARVVRGEVLHIKTRDFVVSAQALGARTPRILLFHIWPNVLSVLVVQASFGMAGAVLAESALSFLGLGAPPSVPTWGSMLNTGRAFLFQAPHISIFPGLALMSLVLGFNLFGDSLRDLLDPRN